MAQISVLIPVYNAENYLPDCLDSLRRQTFSDFEAILINDGSRDATASICDIYANRDPRFRVVYQKNAGAGAARNAAIEEAMKTPSSFLAWVDGDDVLHPEYLRQLYDQMQKNPQCDIVQCGHTRDLLKMSAPEDPELCFFTSGKELLLHMENGIDYSVLWNKLYRKTLYQNARVRIDEQITGRIHNDVNLLWQVYTQSQGACCISSQLYYYRQVPGSIQHRKLGRRNLEIFALYHWMTAEFRNMPGYEEVAAYFAGKCIFRFAYLLRLPEKCYENYPQFYQALKETHRVLSGAISLRRQRLDLVLLHGMGKRCFWCFRCYGLLWKKIKEKQYEE